MVPCKERAQNWDIRARSSHHCYDLYPTRVETKSQGCVTPRDEVRYVRRRKATTNGLSVRKGEC